jgi:Spy/CpxP family protein refolding chaperone
MAGTEKKQGQSTGISSMDDFEDIWPMASRYAMKGDLIISSRRTKMIHDKIRFSLACWLLIFGLGLGTAVAAAAAAPGPTPLPANPAQAGPNMGPSMPMGPGMNMGQGMEGMGMMGVPPEKQAEVKKIRDEYKDRFFALHQDLRAKHAELEAIMLQAQPDVNKAKAVAKEITGLIEQVMDQMIDMNAKITKETGVRLPVGMMMHGGGMVCPMMGGMH